MGQEVLEESLGEFYPECPKPNMNHFRHIVGNQAALAQSSIDLGRPEEAETCYETIRKYAQALRDLPDFRKREFLIPLPPECDECDRTSVNEYIESAYSQFEKSSE